MLIVELKNVRLFGNHGVTKEERYKGGMYEVNLEVKFKEIKEVINDVYDTVDYSELFKIVKERMAQPSELMESIAMEIVRRVKERYFQIREIKIQIIKLNPPIDGFEGQTAVNCIRTY